MRSIVREFVVGAVIAGGRRKRIAKPLLFSTLFLLIPLAVPAPSAPSGAASDPWEPQPYEGPELDAGSSRTQTPKKVLEATKLIKEGKKYSLGHVYDSVMPTFPGQTWVMEMKPPTQAGRQTFNVEYFHGEVGQNGTQFDALGHFGIQPSEGLPDPLYDPSLLKTLYHGRLTGQQVHGPTGLQRLGVEHIKPFFTRGILIDIKHYFYPNESFAPDDETTILENVLTPQNPEKPEITMDMVRKALAVQEMSEDDIQEGDVVLFRTGWEVNWDEGTPVYYAGAPGLPGKTPGIGLEVAKWLASKRVACVGADNWGVSAAPSKVSGDGIPETILEPVHNELLVKHGIPHQESMHLSELAKDAAAQNAKGLGRDAYTFAYIYVPVPIAGASGSPGIPLAVK